MARAGASKHEPVKDFVESNLVAHEENRMGPKFKLQQIEKNKLVVRERQENARKRRD